MSILFIEVWLEIVTERNSDGGSVMKITKMKMVAFIMIFTLSAITLFQEFGGSVFASDSDYSVESILSKYQYFVKNDLVITNGHTVGGLVVGGKGTITNFGDAAVADSYINEIIKVGNYTNSGWLAPDYPEMNFDQCKVFYTTNSSTTNVSGNLSFEQCAKDAKIDVTSAFTQIIGQSSAWVTQSTKSYLATDAELKKSSSVKQVEMWGSKLNALYIDKADDIVNVDGDLFNTNVLDNGTNYRAIVLKGYSSLDDLITKQKVINITGSSSFKLGNDNSGPTSSNNRIFIYICDEDGNNLKLIDSNTGLKQLTGVDQGGQLYTKGMKLIWNFPEATNINADFIPGHVVAPKADIAINGGNFEGNYIGANVTSAGEGHFFPYNGVGVEPSPSPTVEVVTPTPVAPTPAAPTPVAPTPAAPTPVAPTPGVVTPTPVAPTPGAVTPTPAAPTPGVVTPTPVAPTPGAVTPTPAAPTPGAVTPTPAVPTPGAVTPTPATPTPGAVTPTPTAPTPTPTAPTPTAPTPSPTVLVVNRVTPTPSSDDDNDSDTAGADADADTDTSSSSSASDEGNDSAVQTGDNFPYEMAVVIMALAACGLVAVIRLRKKQED